MDPNSWPRKKTDRTISTAFLWLSAGNVLLLLVFLAARLCFSDATYGQEAKEHASCEEYNAWTLWKLFFPLPSGYHDSSVCLGFMQIFPSGDCSHVNKIAGGKVAQLKEQLLHILGTCAWIQSTMWVISDGSSLFGKWDNKISTCQFLLISFKP